MARRSTIALVGLLACMAAPAFGQSKEPRRGPAKQATACDGEVCQHDDQLLFRLHTRGERESVTGRGIDVSSSASLQPDRRASIEWEPPGKAVVTGRLPLAFPDGGSIWVTQDPDTGPGELTVSAPSLVAFADGRLLEPVRFYVRSNYPAFVERYSISLYDAADGDRIEPLAVINIEPASVAEVSWDGALPPSRERRAGDALIYVLRAYAADGTFDETHPGSLTLAPPGASARALGRLRTGPLGEADNDLPEALDRSLLDAVFARNGVGKRNIPLRGSRVRIHGRDIPAGLSLSIDGAPYPLDIERKFVAEYLLPVGRHAFELHLVDENAVGGTGDLYPLEIDVSGRYFFAVAMADLTVSGNRVSGSPAPSAVDDRYGDDLISDGRLAFYGKAKFRGKYLVTAQADTTERDLERLFDDFTEAYPGDIFRRLDPDLYYPTYGDDSSVQRDVDTMGRFYLRADWDSNQALWGNYATGLVGTEFAQYQRSLYGAALDWRSLDTTSHGNPRGELRAFASEAQTAPGHDELLGTTGSLYYLRHTDILPGSEQVVLEVRDPATGRVERRTTLTRGVDYDIDELQGRILLTRPLAQVTRENIVTLTRDAPLDGLQQRLVVDYEWLPSAFDNEQLTGGVRARHWFGEHAALGATYVDEGRSGEDYRIIGSDLTLRAGNGTYIKAEFARTESFTQPVFFSDNGGFTFNQLAVAGPREGEAKSVETRANFRELSWTERDWTAGGWWREVDDGYSLNRYPSGRPVEERGVEVLGELAANWSLFARLSDAETGDDALQQAQATLEWRIDESNALSGEWRQVRQSDGGSETTGVLGALRYTRNVSAMLDLYAQAQATLDDEDGRYADNDAVSVGSRYSAGEHASLSAEVTSGDRGDAAQLGAEYRLTAAQTVYGGYTWSTDSTGHHALFNPRALNGWTLGQRRRVSHQVSVFNESQFLKEPNQAGLAHTFGIDFFPAEGWNVGVTLQDGEFDSVAGPIDRRAVSVRGGRTSADTDWQSKLERREDTGIEQRDQWVTSTRLTHRFSRSLRVAMRANYAETHDHVNARADARFAEGNLGFAWRPWNSQRWGLFGRYTYLYDLASMAQEGGAQVDQRSHVLSFEGVYHPRPRWEYAVRVSRREGEVRMERGTGAWHDSATTFIAPQLRYELRHKWHALAEYRWLLVDDGGTRNGVLLGVDRDLSEWFRLGAGYNFAEFSDDLTNFDYRQRGWFVSLLGSY